MTKEAFAAEAEKNVILLDGAMGTNLYLAGMPKGVSTEDWILRHEETAETLLRGYARAGAQVLYAPTFGANRHVLESFGLEGRLEEMNRRLIELARRAGGDQVWIAGDIAPTGMLLEEAGGEYTAEQIFEVYREQILILADAGADLIVAETMMSVDEASIAVDAAHSACDLPVLCSLSVTADGRAYYGGTIQEAAEVLSVMEVSAIGVNCCSGPDQLESIVANIKKLVQVPVLAKPNAGMPRIGADGTAVYEMGPAEFAGHMMKLVKAGAGIIGGCCGTTPEYIRKLRLALDRQLLTGRG